MIFRFAAPLLTVVFAHRLWIKIDAVSHLRSVFAHPRLLMVIAQSCADITSDGLSGGSPSSGIIIPVGEAIEKTAGGACHCLTP